jgi:RNA polymerase sigma-70 factor (ECF subfamily)
MRRAEFDAAVEQHSRRVFTLAVYLLGDRGEAEDVTQDVLIRLWQKGHEVAPDRIGSWLVRVTRNACVDAIRRRVSGIRGVTDLREDSPPEAPFQDPGPEALARSSQLRGWILAALQRLSEPHRSVVILREIQGLSYQEIGEALEMPLSNVRITLHRGRRRLREELREVRSHVAAS